MKPSYQANDTQIYISASLVNASVGKMTLSSNLKKYSTVMDQHAIRKLELVSNIVSPIMTGSVIYEDDVSEALITSHGNIDLYLQLSIRFTGSEITQGIKSDETSFSHLFYVNNVEILTKTAEVTTYKLDLLSINFWYFMNNKHISSFNESTDTMPSIDMIQELMNGLKMGDTTLASDTPVTFISPANTTVLDSLMTVLSMNMEKPDSTLMLMPFDHMIDTYDVWMSDAFDATKPVYSKKDNNILKLNISSLSEFNILKNDIGAINTQNYVSNKEIIKSTLSTIEHDFSYDDRSFSYEVFDRLNIENTFGSKLINTGMESRIKRNFDVIDTDLVNLVYENGTGSAPSFFKRVMRCLTENGALLVNVPGEITRKPGTEMFISVDTNKDDHSSLIAFQGRWLATTVRHIFEPKANVYSNTLMLSRMERPTNPKDFRSEL